MINLVAHEVSLKARTGGAWGLGLTFYALSLFIIPIITSINSKILSEMAPGFFWIISSFAILLMTPHMIQEDIDDGSIQQLRLVPYSPGAIYVAKLIATMILAGIPIIFITGLMTPIYHLGGNKAWLVAITQALGLPGIICLSLTLSIMTAHSKSANLLIPILILPLSLPIFIFGTTAIDAMNMGTGILSHIYLLSASSLTLLVIGTFAGAYVLDEIAD